METRKRYKRIILVGPGASGKSYLYDAFPERTRGVKYTTRPMRPGERHGYDYHFVEDYTFNVMQKEGLFKIVEEFTTATGVWKYGTTLMEWDEKQTFILPPRAIERLPRKEMNQCFVVYLDISKSTRSKRLSARCSADTVERRLDDDFLAFAGFRGYNYHITDAHFDRKVLADRLQNKII